MSNKQELFEKITRAKQLNQSQCDRMRNIDTRSLIISRVLNERFPIFAEEDLIVLDDSFKCNWYWYYKFFTKGELYKCYSDLLQDWIKLNNHVKQRSKQIAKWRKEMCEIKTKGFKE